MLAWPLSPFISNFHYFSNLYAFLSQVSLDVAILIQVWLYRNNVPRTFGGHGD